MNLRHRLAVAFTGIICALALAQHSVLHAQGAPANKRDVRYVVLHRPGPAWLPGKSMFEQPGIRAHVEHYRKWLEAGKLQLGGPHLDPAGGGMMIPAQGVQEAEVRAFALADPAVKDGTLIAEVRPWLIGMSQ